MILGCSQHGCTKCTGPNTLDCTECAPSYVNSETEGCSCNNVGVYDNGTYCAGMKICSRRGRRIEVNRCEG